MILIFAIMTLAVTLLNEALMASYMRKAEAAVMLHAAGGVVFVYAAVKFVMMTW